jgi:hypothetical protein
MEGYCLFCLLVKWDLVLILWIWILFDPDRRELGKSVFGLVRGFGGFRMLLGFDFVKRFCYMASF